MNQLPLVSICSITYNHAPYIRQCLDGMLMQQTDFPFEIIINDDCSTDGTTEIIREYAERYPDIIRPIFHDENQYQKGVQDIFASFVYPKVRGKYIALCEGDDYWTDPHKLQKQVDFLESHPDYVMCSHFWNEYHQGTQELIPCKNVKSKIYTLQSLIDEEWLFQPLTVVYRSSALQQWGSYKASRDTVLFYYLLKQGKGFCMPDTMGVYRLHDGGVWTGTSDEVRWLSDFKVREAIYDKERTDDAAQFLLNVITRKPIGRSFLLHRRKELECIFKVTCRHKGFFQTLCIFAKRMYSSSVL